MDAACDVAQCVVSNGQVTYNNKCKCVSVHLVLRLGTMGQYFPRDFGLGNVIIVMCCKFGKMGEKHTCTLHLPHHQCEAVSTPSFTRDR